MASVFAETRMRIVEQKSVLDSLGKHHASLTFRKMLEEARDIHPSEIVKKIQSAPLENRPHLTNAVVVQCFMTNKRTTSVQATKMECWILVST